MEKKPPTAQDYLLDERESDDPYFRTPIREKARVTPLIDGEETYQAMEEAIAGAKRSVFMAFWVFFPNTPLQSPAVKRLLLVRGKHKRPLCTWGDLLQYAVGQQGVDLRILLTDFDPVFGSHHADAWSSYRELCMLAQPLKQHRDRFQVICSRHPARTTMIEKEVRAGLLGKIKRLNEGAISFRNQPGLWTSITYHRGRKPRFALASQPDLAVYPVAHHQKLCIVDGEVAFCGGLDVSNGRIGTPGHRSKALWHDIDCRVEGTPVGDILRNFISRWNQEIAPFQEFVRSANRAGGPHFKLPPMEVSALDEAGRQATTTPGNAFVQVLRTVSSDNPFSPIPKAELSDIEEMYRKAIAHARSYVYIENQYLRAVDLASWLVARREEAPDLQVIIVIPVAPEELKMRNVDPITAHGIALQYEALTLLQKEFGKRDPPNLGVYSIAAPYPAKDRSRVTNTCDSYMIYVHSKLLIVDDVFASIGSANTTLRSFRLDTELGVGWFEPDKVREFRLRLWHEMLGCDQKTMSQWEPGTYVTEWQRIARQNASIVPGKRQGLIVPHDLKNGKVYPGQKGRFPDVFAEWIDLDPEEVGAALA